MPFKSDEQRKGFFASRANSKGAVNPQRVGRLRDMSFKQLKRKGIKLDPKGDADKDGIPNAKDCKPFNPKRQGILHDLAIKRLRKKEEKLERKREKEQKKLEDLRDRLNEKRSVVDKKASIKTLQLKQKQAVIDQMSEEKRKLNAVKEANIAAKKELEKGSVKEFLKKSAKGTGRVIGKGAGATSRFLSSERTKKAIRNSTLALGKAAGLLTKKQVKGIKRRFKR